VKPAAAILWGALIVSVAFVLDTALGHRIAIRGVRPDLSLAALAPVALAVRAAGGAWLGLFAGILRGSFVSLAFGSYAVSRCLAGWLTGLLQERFFRDNLLVTVAAGLMASLAADLTFFAFAPQPDARQYLLHAGGRALYTAVLVIPFALLVRRMYPSTV